MFTRADWSDALLVKAGNTKATDYTRHFVEAWGHREIMHKLASHADLWYNKHMNVLPRRCLQHPGADDKEGTLIMPPIIPPTEKRCTRCGETKPASAFYKQKAHSTGLASSCKKCDSARKNKEVEYERQRRWRQNNGERVRANWRKRHAKYKAERNQASRDYYREHSEEIRGKQRMMRTGWTVSEFSRKIEEQEGKCAICGCILIVGSTHGDHDHVTNQPRGILCQKCNQALGLFQDSPQLLRQAASYLDRYV